MSCPTLVFPPSQRPRRLARPRTSPFHGGNAGSNPAGDAKILKGIIQLVLSTPPQDTDKIPIERRSGVWRRAKPKPSVPLALAVRFLSLTTTYAYPRRESSTPETC